MDLSIITVTMNAEHTLQRAISSSCQQGSSLKIEHIVVDGASTDSTVSILRGSHGVKWVSEPDSGQSEAMNKGISMAKGAYIGFLNADDEYASGLFERLAEAIADNAGKANSSSYVFDLVIRESSGQEHVSVPSVRYSDIADPRKFAYPLNPLSYFVPANVVRSIAPYPLSLHYAMDYWFLLRLYERYPVKHISQKAGTFHNYANKTSDVARAELEVAQVLLQHLRERYGLAACLHANFFRALVYKAKWKKALLKRAKTNGCGSGG
jgi:glycosyltransferase involved in cell wall biosynthesis